MKSQPVLASEEVKGGIICLLNPNQHEDRTAQACKSTCAHSEDSGNSEKSECKLDNVTQRLQFHSQ